MLRPTFFLELDLDSRQAKPETLQELKRCYMHVSAPQMRTHELADATDADPLDHILRMDIEFYQRAYLYSKNEDADAHWAEEVAPWLKSMFYKIGNNMKVFNDRQREIRLPEVIFRWVEMNFAEEGDPTFTVRIHPDAQSVVENTLVEHVTQARDLLNNGTLASAVKVEIPASASFMEQRAKAWDAWVEENPDAPERLYQPLESRDIEDVAEDTRTREEILEADKEAKSYENTAVPPTDSATLPPINRAEAEEIDWDDFNFTVDYTLWGVTFADGTVKNFDTTTGAFV